MTEEQHKMIAELMEVVEQLEKRVKALENRGPGEWTVPASWKEPMGKVSIYCDGDGNQTHPLNKRPETCPHCGGVLPL